MCDNDGQAGAGCSLRQLRLPQGLACCFLLLLLTGCPSEKNTRGDPSGLLTANSAELRGREYTPQTLWAPLRRTACCAQDALAAESWGGTVPQDLLAGAAVNAALQDGGVMRLRLALPYDVGALAEELKKLGFGPEPPARTGERFWTRAVAAEERAAFTQQVLARIEEATRQLEQLRILDLRARQPGRIVWSGPGVYTNLDEPRKFLPGKLVYTGHPLDIALADAGSDPQMFFCVDSLLYVRGGRLFVAEDGTVRLGDFKPAGEWRKAPATTEQIAVYPSGQLFAYLRDGTTLELGRLLVAGLMAFKPAAVEGAVENLSLAGLNALDADESPLRIGHLEYANLDQSALAAQAGGLLAARQVLSETLRALQQSALPPGLSASPFSGGAIIIHANLTWTEQHLKALGAAVERTPGHTMIPLANEPQKIVDALTKVLQVLRLRMAIHDQNLRNADRVRDAENRLNPYRRQDNQDRTARRGGRGSGPVAVPQGLQARRSERGRRGQHHVAQRE